MASSSETLLIVGSIAFDSVETPAGSAEMALGGSATYAAIAASYFAAPRVVGVVGEDFDDTHMERFSGHGVDVAGIERVEGKTFHWKGRYHADFKGRDTLQTELNVFENFNPVVPEAWRDARHIFLANIAPQLQARVLDQAPSATFVAMDTMNLWIDIARNDLEQVMGRVDMVFINDEEAFQFTGETSLLSAARAIRSLGPRYAVIKKGEHGAVLFGPDETLFVPAVLLERVVDPTGAGDTFAGGFLGALASRGAFDRATLGGALVDGTVLASFSVEAFSVDGICGLDADALDGRRRELERLFRF